ncbi:MAG: RNA polymerase sigma factor [Polyangiaceae bacterium]
MAANEAPKGPPADVGDDWAEQAESLSPLVRAAVAAVLREHRAHPDVEDCTHETLRRAIEGRSRLREGEPIRPWLLGIARHVALDTLRARSRHRMRIVEPTREGDESPLDRVPDSAAPVDERLDRAERAERIRSAMQRLPADQRRAIELFHVEGLGYGEIAQRMQVPMGTVCTWISRARRAIRDALGEEGMTP